MRKSGMKVTKIFVPFLMVILIWGAYGQSIKEIKQVEYSSSTRGSYKQLIFTPKEMIRSEEDRRSSNDEKRSTQKLKSGEWKALCETLKTVELNRIPELKSPTMKRAYDGARTSTITITLKNGTALSHSFDNEDPHEQLSALMKVIIQLDSTNKKGGQ